MQTAEEKADIVGSPRFSEQLAELEGGVLDLDLTLEQQDIVRAVRESGQPGAVTLTINIKPCDNEGSQVEMTAKISSKKPRSKRRLNLRFTKSDGSLVHDDPNQLTLPDMGAGN